MPAVKGKDGIISIGGADVAQVTAYSLTESVETAETTSFGDASRSHVPTLKSWEGSCDIIWNEQEIDDGDLVPGAAVALILYPAGTGTSNYSGNIIITSNEITGETADVVQATINFTGTGDLTRTNV
jgi:hypothetical protein